MNYRPFEVATAPRRNIQVWDFPVLAYLSACKLENHCLATAQNETVPGTSSRKGITCRECKKKKSLDVLSEKCFQPETLDLNDKEIKSAFKRITTKTPQKQRRATARPFSVFLCRCCTCLDAQRCSHSFLLPMGPLKGQNTAVVPTRTSMRGWEEEEGRSALTEVNSLLRAAAVIEP